jgi:hypothetical protein
MPHRPHIMSNGRPKAPRDIVITDLIRPDLRRDAGRAAWEVGSPNRERADGVPPSLRRRVALTSIVGVEAAVLLAILSTLARGPADFRRSAWTLAGLSLLFLVLSQIRRWVTVHAPGD